MKKMLFTLTLHVFFTVLVFAQTSPINTMGAEFNEAFRTMDVEFKQMDAEFNEAFRTMDVEFKQMDVEFDLAFKDMDTAFMNMDFEQVFDEYDDSRTDVDADTTLTESERSWLIEELLKSQKRFEESVADLTKAQLVFKSDSLKWSIEEVKSQAGFPK